MRKRRNFFESEAYAEVNITPMLDLAWNLLVVFIVMVTAAVQGIQVNLPKASAAPQISKPSTKAITIASDGQIYLDAYPVTMDQLESMLSQYKASNPDFPVVVKGDSQIYYQQVIDILDLLQKLEITQLGLVTQKLVK
jgi:biopolymer transport protein ExbD